VTALSLGAVHKSFDRTQVLRGVDLDVADGSLTAVLGPSGSGKTTLLRVVAGFERADSGTVTLGSGLVDGPRRYVPPERRRLGYVPQEGALFPHLSVAANVSFGLRGGRSAAGRRRVEELLELVDLAGLRDRHPHELSGGQQQRVALARALAVSPAVVLLDEPFTALDPALRASVRAEVVTILRTAGATAILVTHDQDEALSMADRVAVLRGGVVVQNATPHDLYREPLDPELARFLGEANLLAGTIDGADAITALGRMPVRGRPGTPGERVLALLRPEQLTLEPAGAPGLRGRVVSTEYYGHDAVVYVEPDPEAAPGIGTLTIRLQGSIPPEPGCAVAVAVAVAASGPVTVWPDMSPPGH
jgi:iron(III) transport system ATP-binding protein